MKRYRPCLCPDQRGRLHHIQGKFLSAPSLPPVIIMKAVAHAEFGRAPHLLWIADNLTVAVGFCNTLFNLRNMIRGDGQSAHRKHFSLIAKSPSNCGLPHSVTPYLTPETQGLT